MLSLATSTSRQQRLCLPSYLPVNLMASLMGTHYRVGLPSKSLGLRQLQMLHFPEKRMIWKRTCWPNLSIESWLGRLCKPWIWWTLPSFLYGSSHRAPQLDYTWCIWLGAKWLLCIRPAANPRSTQLPKLGIHAYVFEGVQNMPCAWHVNGWRQPLPMNQNQP